MAITAKRNERFNTRISKEMKELFDQAREIGGFSSLSDFVLVSATEKAKSIIMEHNKLTLSRQDSKIFMEALANPPLPNDKLKQAWAGYKE